MVEELGAALTRAEVWTCLEVAKEVIILQKEVIQGAGGMAQSAKLMLCKHEDPGSTPM